MPLDEVSEHIRYLKEKIAHLKGVKINYHEQFTSQLEAVLTRGDDNLCAYIETLYKKGCYLDAWGEHFKEDIWKESAKELNIDIAKLAQKEYPITEELPWDFINTGVDKAWLIKEYEKAFTEVENSDTNSVSIVPTCETKCVNCGVCKNLKTRKILAQPFVASPKAQSLKTEIKDPKTCTGYDKEIFRYRIKLTKTGILKYFSHLDWQNTFLKALSRTDLNVVFSLGYNPMMKVSMGIALPLFAQSECEFVDIELFDNISPDILKNKLEKVLPQGSKIISIVNIAKSEKSFDITAQWAEYQINIFDKSLYDFENLRYNTDKVLSSEEIFIEKKNKKGLLKKTNIKPSIKSYRFEGESLFIVLKTGQTVIDKENDNAGIPALRADVLMKLIAPDVIFDIKRVRFFDTDMHEIQ
jgi:radical SAM-linked protein